MGRMEEIRQAMDSFKANTMPNKEVASRLHLMGFTNKDGGPLSVAYIGALKKKPSKRSKNKSASAIKRRLDAKRGDDQELGRMVFDSNLPPKKKMKILEVLWS